MLLPLKEGAVPLNEGQEADLGTWTEFGVRDEEHSEKSLYGERLLQTLPQCLRLFPAGCPRLELFPFLPEGLQFPFLLLEGLQLLLEDF